MVLTLQLTGVSATGVVSGSSDAGDPLAVAADVASGGNRLVVLYGVAATG